MKHNLKIGAQGEIIAQNFLTRNNFKILDKNFRVGKLAEIDIIATKNHKLHFIEVKARTNKKFGWPEEAVSDLKLEKINQAALAYLEKNNLRQNWQIDIISILLNQSERVATLWFFPGV
ncbi:MAG: YraN family protein [Candidatus Buchananbacteria bacterium]